MNFLIVSNDIVMINKMNLKIHSLFTECSIKVIRSLKEYRPCSYDVFFIDLDLKNDHIQVFIKYIKEIRKNAFIIFISSQSKLYTLTFQMHAYWFIDKHDFQKQLHNALTSLYESYDNHNFLLIHCKKNIIRIKVNDLFCVYKEGSKICYITKDIAVEDWNTMKQVEDILLKNSSLFKINSGIIINVKKIQLFDTERNIVILTNQMSFPVSRRKKQELYNHLKSLSTKNG